jgi:hypothetical protein
LDSGVASRLDVGPDSTAARALFQQTYVLLKGIEPSGNQKETKSIVDKLPQGTLTTLYVLFFSFVGKHDAAWKEQLEMRLLNLSAIPAWLAISTLRRQIFC